MSVWDFQLLTKKSRTYSSCEVISSNLKNWHLFDAAFLRAGAAFARSPAQRILRLSTPYIAHKEDSKVFQFEKKTFFVFFHLPSILPMSMMTISWVLWTVETLPKTPPLRDLVWNPVQFLISNLFLTLNFNFVVLFRLNIQYFQIYLIFFSNLVSFWNTCGSPESTGPLCSNHSHLNLNLNTYSNLFWLLTTSKAIFWASDWVCLLIIVQVVYRLWLVKQLQHNIHMHFQRCWL